MIEHFHALDIQAGTIIDARPNPKAKKAAHILGIDFGGAVGIKTSSAQITDLYPAESLIGRQVLGIVNLAPRRVAGVLSEVLILGCLTAEGVVLISPDRPVPPGSKVG